MSYEDFCRLTPEEAEEAFRAWRETREADQRECWERMRRPRRRSGLGARTARQISGNAGSVCAFTQ